MPNAGIASTLARIRRRLIPFLFLLYVVSYLDRINVGFAALQMNQALGLSATAYGLGAGIFFLSYTLFEVPSNLILARVGARIWIARIMITWGVVSAGMMFARGPMHFYALRFLLGAAEAGFFPGIIYYLTEWPAPRTGADRGGLHDGHSRRRHRRRPRVGALLSMHGAGGLAGWQWLFLLEGLPAIVLGIVVLWWLPDGPHDATWLSAAGEGRSSARSPKTAPG
jgi:ACS family tartrate transporter-like MFS transporter